jgi:integrase
VKVTYIERQPGTWRLRIERGRDANNKRLFSYETIQGVEDDAARRRFELLQAHDDGTYAKPDKITFSAAFKQWVKTRRALKKIGRNSEDNYLFMFDEYVEPTLGGMKLQKVTGADIQGVYTRLLTEPSAKREELSPNTVYHLHRILSAFFGKKMGMRKAKVIKVNPMEEVEPPQPTKTEPKAIRDALVPKLLATLECNWMLPIVMLIVGTGLRRGEVIGLRWKDIDLDAAKVRVVGQMMHYRDGTVEWLEQPKTAAGVRTIALATEYIALLRQLKIEAAKLRLKAGLGGGLEDAWVFTRDGVNWIKPGTFGQAFSDHCDQHGFPELTAHGVRHTHITSLLRKVGKTGAKAVSERAGHADLMITLRIYQTVFEEDDIALGELSGGLLGSKK